MAITLTTGSRNAACDAVVDRVDAGAAAGKLKIYAGGVGGTLLATFTLSDPAFGNAGASVAGQAALLGVPLSTTASGTGTANAFAFTDSDDVEHWRGSVTATGGGGDLTIDNVSVASGQTVRVTGYNHNQPA